MDRYPMTAECQEKLKKELDHLKRTERPRVIKDIEEARAHGDLSENAEYDAAKNRQGMIEAKILDIEGKLSRAVVVDPAKQSTEKVAFGLKVTALDLNTDKEFTYQIVSEDEADVTIGKISYTSPIGKALLGKAEGDNVKIQVPIGEKEFEIIAIEKP
jgi:transcription elongation factor GreA